MNIFNLSVTCEVCGCEGAATPKVVAAAWTKGNFVSHRDPQVCADNLKRKKADLDKREKQLQEKEKS
jgi:hypothetical protein